MAIEKILYRLPGAIAGADMSGANGGSTNGYGGTAQYLFGKLSADDTVVPCAALTDCPIGIIQTNPKAGSGYSNVGVEVGVSGYSKVMVGASNLTAGTLVGPDANGKAVARAVASGGGDATHWVAGIIVEGANSGNLATVYLFGAPQYLQA